MTPIKMPKTRKSAIIMPAVPACWGSTFLTQTHKQLSLQPKIYKKTFGGTYLEHLVTTVFTETDTLTTVFRGTDALTTVFTETDMLKKSV